MIIEVPTPVIETVCKSLRSSIYHADAQQIQTKDLREKVVMQQYLEDLLNALDIFEDYQIRKD